MSQLRGGSATGGAGGGGSGNGSGTGGGGGGGSIVPGMIGSLMGGGGGEHHHHYHSLHYSSVHSATYQAGGMTGGMAAAYMANKTSQASRRSAVTKCSLDDELFMMAHQSDDEFLSNLELIMNSTEFADGQFGLTYLKCLKCDVRLECYGEDVIGSLIVVCSTVIHRELSLVSPFLIDMIIPIMRYLTQLFDFS